MATAPTKAVLRPEEAAEYVGRSARSFAELRKRDDFPKPRDLTGTGRHLVWLRSELDAFLSALPPAPIAPEPAQLRRARTERAPRSVLAAHRGCLLAAAEGA